MKYLTTLTLALLVATAAGAAEPLWLNYGAYQAKEHPGTDADNQGKFSFATPVKQVYEHAYWGIPVAFKFAAQFTGTGFIDEASSPVMVDYAPETWGEIPLGENTTFNLGAQHQSNGEDGIESRSWNKVFGRVNLTRHSGDWTLDTSSRIWWIAQNDNPTLAELRALGDADGKWGIEGTYRLTHATYGSVAADIKGNLAFVAVTFNVLDGELQPMVYGLVGKAAQLEELDTVTKAIGVGATVEW